MGAMNLSKSPLPVMPFNNSFVPAVVEVIFSALVHRGSCVGWNCGEVGGEGLDLEGLKKIYESLSIGFPG
jgi:hypothetical protein